MGRELAAALPGALFTTVKEADHLVTVEHRQDAGSDRPVLRRNRPIVGLPYYYAVEPLGPALPSWRPADEPSGPGGGSASRAVPAPRGKANEVTGRWSP